MKRIILSIVLILLIGCTNIPINKISKEDAEFLAKEYTRQWNDLNSRTCGNGYCPQYQVQTIRVNSVEAQDSYWKVAVYYAYTYRATYMESEDGILTLSVDYKTGQTHAIGNSFSDEFGRESEQRGQILVRKI